VVKLFAAQNTDAVERLTTTHMQRVAERIVARIEQSLSLVIASSQPGKNGQRHPTAAFVA
jgi:hypothetical protein